MSEQVMPYCGWAPAPGELLHRFNLDPVLIVVLVGVAAAQLVVARRGPARTASVIGWSIGAAAFLSPLCALSVALFSARIAQHMILVLIAAPLISLSLSAPRAKSGSWTLWMSTCGFGAALWFWHMPVPYDATFASTSLYWSMHVTLFGSALILWRELLLHPPRRTAAALVAGTITSVQMGLLGAVLTFAGHPLYLRHLTSTQAWGLSPLRDQQLGGVLMWVPGIALFILVAVRSLTRAWATIQVERAV